jgi:hypothetical protein
MLPPSSRIAAMRLSVMHRLSLVALLAGLAALALACGGGSSPSSGQEGGAPAGKVNEDNGEKVSLITRPDSIYSVDDLIAAGWKKSKEFDASPLPQAKAAIYGFFNRKDIEVWVYDSHDAALRYGVDPAEKSIARKPGQTDYLIPRVNRYFAYAVAGNLVLLCETQLEDCETLIEELP